jgi:hypothetical protein
MCNAVFAEGRKNVANTKVANFAAESSKVSIADDTPAASMLLYFFRNGKIAHRASGTTPIEDDRECC